MPLQKGVLGSMPPTNWVKSQAVVGELLCVLAEPVVKTQHLRTITAERICRIWTCWKWYVTCGMPCPFSLFPSPCAVWGLPALGCGVPQFLQQDSQLICLTSCFPCSVAGSQQSTAACVQWKSFVERELGDSPVVGPGISQSQTQSLPRLYQLENLALNQPCENHTPFNTHYSFHLYK